jgi:alkanesulfonate monooxygenase
VRDREKGIFTHPQKVHPIRHSGKYYTVPGIHLSEPSPQRTPVLYQAGASSRGKDFAGAHAENIFVAAPSKAVLKRYVANVRQAAERLGRNPREILAFNLQTVVLGETDAEAQRKFNEYREYASFEGALTLISGWTGIDFGQFGPDEVLRHRHTNAVQSAVETFTTIDPTKEWTVREMADWVGVGGFGPVFVGSPSTVADLMQEWIEDTDVDGFNLAYAVTPESFEDAVDLLVPELQKRGVYKTEYRPGTLREKLGGAGPRLVAPHPGAAYRDLPQAFAQSAE